jgi:hypothetical protein
MYAFVSDVEAGAVTSDVEAGACWLDIAVGFARLSWFHEVASLSGMGELEPKNIGASAWRAVKASMARRWGEHGLP